MLDVIARRIDGSPGFEHQRPEATLAQLLRRPAARDPGAHHDGVERLGEGAHGRGTQPSYEPGIDRKSTRLNSSHLVISYAVFCLKKKKTTVSIGALGALAVCGGRPGMLNRRQR